MDTEHAGLSYVQTWVPRTADNVSLRLRRAWKDSAPSGVITPDMQLRHPARPVRWDLRRGADGRRPYGSPLRDAHRSESW
jgi:hypothetical protein